MPDLPPLFSPLLRQRSTAIAVSLLAAAQVVLTFFGVSAWTCPSLSALSLPCPGCGLSRAAAALVSLDFATMWMMHPFAPALLVALTLFALVAVSPRTFGRRLASAVELVERRTGLCWVLLIGLLVFWIVRLTSDPAGLVATLAAR